MNFRFLPAALMANLLLGAGTAPGADWPVYRGPQHDGTSTEKLPSKNWPATGPKQIWRTPLTDGFSSFSVAGGKAFTLVKRSEEGVAREVCVALDTKNGKELWAAQVGLAKYDGGGDSGTADNKGGDGPRSTPSFDGNRVYVLSADLVLSCLDAGTGKAVWSKDLIKGNGARNISWKNAASPVIEGDLIFVCGGGDGQALLGIDKKDGKIVWKSENDKMTHATPTLATIHGLRQVIFFTQSGLVSAETRTGKILWRYPFRFNVSTAAAPVVSGDFVYCSAGYGVGAGLAKVTKDGAGFKAEEVWRKTGDKPLANHWSTPVVKDGHLYGMFQFKEYGSGPLKCVELATGIVKWEKPGFGPGNVILADNHVIALSDKGEVVLIEANPATYKEVARADVLDGKCWSTPVLSNGRIYARSTKEGVCLDLLTQTAMK